MNFTAASAFLDAMFEWTWRTSLYASVLIVLVCLTQLAGGKWLAPRWRYLLGILILVRLLAPAVPGRGRSQVKGR
jgi:beta-lactamase regulating signal transducer with metallopeptidase domain